jgi:formate hydrogenlyase transcriptional activator
MDLPEAEVRKVPKLKASAGERISFESLISDLSARFINVPPAMVDEEIEQALGQLREFFQLDRAGLMEVAKTGKTVFLTHASYAEGLPQVPKTVDIGRFFPWCYREIVERSNVLVCRSPEDVPDEAEEDRKNLSVMGIKTLLDIPLFHDGRVAFILAIDSTREERLWPEEFLPRLRLLGEIFVNALVRTRAEARLRASEEKFRQFFETSPDFCYIVSPQGNIIEANNSAIQTLGYEKGELIGRPLELIYAPESQETRAGLFENWKETGLIRNAELVIAAKDGGKRTVLLNAGAVRDENGTLLHSASVQTDITSRKQMESQLAEQLRQIEDLKRQLEAENIYLREETRGLLRHGPIVGNSPALRAVMTQVQQVARTNSTVLLLGETGTGKGLVAQSIHDLSPRKARIMVKVDCASLPATLIESELFGRERGAYTGALTSQIGRFESANGSTIFLDEIAELPLELQAKLLRVVQDGEFEHLGSSKTFRTDVRVIAATNRNLLKETQEGRFREDLYYRLSVFPIHVPALRERPEDIPLLVQAFVSEFSTRMRRNIRPIPKQVIEALQHHNWPGNVRELRNVIERAFIISEGDVLNVTIPGVRSEAASTPNTLQEVDAVHILRTLETCQWRIKGPQGAARLLGLKPSTLYYKMNKLGIPTARPKDGKRT